MEDNIETTELATISVSVPVIPDVLNINGVEFSEEKLRNEVDEIRKLTLKDDFDEEGYLKIKETKSRLTKTRTGAQKWRTQTSKPLTDFNSRLKKKVDDGCAIISEGEEYLESIIVPYENYRETERLRIENEKEAKAVERGLLIKAIGFENNGAGTWDFTLDGADFILHSTLKDWNDEQFNMEYERFKAIWDAEQERLKAEEEARLGAEAKLQSQVADLNAERTEMRKELLEMRGYVLTDGFYNNGTHQSISEGDVVNTPTKAEWDALFVLIPKEMETVEEQQIIAPEPLNEVEMPDVSDMSFEVPEIVEDVPTVAHVEPIAEIGHEETVLDTPTAPEFTKDETTYDCHLVFTKDNPYIEVPIGMMKIRLYHSELEGVSLEGVEKDNIALTGEIKGELKFTVMK